MIAIPHPIRRMIEDQHVFLSYMLDDYPRLLDEWITKQEKEVEDIAKSVAEGDDEVYYSVYSNEIQRIEHCSYEEELFNQAMLIMVYSYYESTLFRLAKEKDVDSPRPSKIAEKIGANVDNELLQISNFLYNTVRPLRNELCHNNSGTLFEESSQEEQANIRNLTQNNVISIDNERITIIDRGFIKQTLDDEYKLLLKLADICGYKTSFIGKK